MRAFGKSLLQAARGAAARLAGLNSESERRHYILWFIFGGFFSGLAWILSGCMWCVTVIGIPYGLQCFKFASLAFSPFGKEVVYGDGAVSFIVNVVWLFINGWWMALGNFVIGCLWCVTIVGIPFGKQFFKIAKLSLAPFGATVEEA